MEKKYFGTGPKGPVDAYTLKNSNGMAVTILTMGGIVQKLLVPTDGGPADVCLGYDTLEEYLAGRSYFGALIGRNGNRIANAEFSIDGKRYPVTPNSGRHQCHGGLEGFDRKLWAAEAAGNSLRLTYLSPDGEEGFPGNVQVTVTYTLGEDNSLRIDYRAVPDWDTVVNLTNHTYFNLNGGGSVENHTLWVDADRYTVNDDEIIPTGEIAAVAGTCLDFRTPKELLLEIDDPMLQKIGGYDHNFCLNGSGLRKVAALNNGALTMEVETTCPGLQLYCAAYKRPVNGKNGARYAGRCFVCLETQAYPDAVHHENFPSTVVRAGETYAETTVYRFRRRSDEII